MAPKQGKAAAAKKNPGKNSANDNKRKSQANMVTQLANARKKCKEMEAKKDEGGEVDERVLADLQTKVSFDDAYRRLSQFSSEKTKMLELREQDKSCKKWSASVTTSVGRTETETATGVGGWCSRGLVILFYYPCSIFC